MCFPAVKNQSSFLGWFLLLCMTIMYNDRECNQSVTSWIWTGLHGRGLQAEEENDRRHRFQIQTVRLLAGGKNRPKTQTIASVLISDLFVLSGESIPRVEYTEVEIGTWWESWMQMCIYAHQTRGYQPGLRAASVKEHFISILRQQSTIYLLFCTISHRQRGSSQSHWAQNLFPTSDWAKMTKI